MTDQQLTTDPSQLQRQLLLTVPETCAVLRVSRWMVYRLIQSRQLTTVKIGSRRLVPAAEVRAFLDRLSQDALT